MEIGRLIDRHEENQRSALPFAPHAVVENNTDALWKDKKTDFVVIATAASTHFALAEKALHAGKHVLVEKPVTLTLSETEALLVLAKKVNRRIFVDHTLLFSERYQSFKAQVKQNLKNGKFFYRSERCGAGTFPKDCGIPQHLLYHDLYLLNDLFGLEHLKLETAIERQIRSPFATDFALFTLSNPSGDTFALCADMISERKTRKTSFLNSAACIVWDDTQLEPKQREPLLVMLEHTVESLQSGKEAVHEGVKSRPIMQFLAQFERKQP